MASISSAMSCEPCSCRRARPICGIIDDCPEADVQGTSGLGALVDWGEMEDVVQRLPSAKKPDWRRRPLQLMSGGAGRGGESSSLPHGAAWRWGCSLSPYSPSPGEPAGTRRDGMGRRRVRIPRRSAGQGGPASELSYFGSRMRRSTWTIPPTWTRSCGLMSASQRSAGAWRRDPSRQCLDKPALRRSPGLSTRQPPAAVRATPRPSGRSVIAVNPGSSRCVPGMRAPHVS